MNISTNILFADAKEERRQGERAFTMVEIAIAIGVIGFALVAVIGILPAGMNVQKDNREDTAISEDAPLFLDAIRNGQTNLAFNPNAPVNGALDFLTNYVEKIMFIGVTNGVTTTNSTIYTKFDGSSGVPGGSEIIGLLSTPENLNVTDTNYAITRAIVRSLGGAAVQQNGANQATSFRYQMDIEIVPFANFANIAPDDIAFNNYLPTNTPDYIIRSNRWLELTAGATLSPSVNFPSGTGGLAYNLYDVRLHFSWPVLPGPGGGEVVGPGRQSYRTMVASGLVPVTYGNGPQLWYFQPQFYATNNQGNL
jgi:type II secretory pathway pseudopilin PulG